MGFKTRRMLTLLIIGLLVTGLIPIRIERVLAGTGGEIYTIAGGNYGDSGDGGSATDAELSYPSAVAMDGSGNLYIADINNNKIRKISTDGSIRTVAGTGNYGYAGDGGQAVDAELRSPSGVAVDQAGNLYIADKYNNRIRKVATDGEITTIAGTGSSGYFGDGGQAVDAKLSSPSGVAVDSAGNIYIADTSNHRIRKVDPSGSISTVAGSDDSGYSGDDVSAVEARLYYPNAVAVDHAGNLYIADTYNNRIRKVDASGNISTVAGSSSTGGYSGDGGQAVDAQLNEPEGIAVDGSGNLYIADTDNNRIRKVIPNGIIMTITGTGTSGYSGDGGPGKLAEIDGPAGLVISSSGDMYIADKYNYAIRKQVTYIPSSDASLNNIVLSSGTLSPAFAPGTLEYSASVVNGVSSIRVTPTTSDSLITVKVNGASVASGSQSGDITLDVGSNTITLVALAEDGVTTKRYTITIERLRSSNANLSQLTLSSGALSPSFASNTTSYTAIANQSGITVTPTMADAMAAVKVNGTTVANGAASPLIPLSVGNTGIVIEVTAQDGTTTKTYTINVTRTISSDANLSGLVLSNGTLSPTFEAGTTNYMAAVGNSVSSITIKPTVADSSSTVSVNDEPVNSGEASASLPLIVGSNTITVKVTAEDGTFKTYTVTVTRAASSNADLSDLALSSGTLTPSFLPGTYKASVGNNVSSVTIKPTAADPTHATVMISLYNGSGDLMSGPLPVASGTASPSLALGVGNNTISLLVTAEDGTTKTYTVTITRGASSDAELSNLTLSNGTLTPAFGGTYTASVGNSVNSITVTATFSDAVNAAAAASVYDSGGTLVSGPHLLISGEASPSLPLSVGSNEISIIVTAQDGTSRTYTVMVTRAAQSNNADLSGLVLSNGTLSPMFGAGTISYTASVGNGVSNITLTPTVADSSSTVSVNDESVNSGEASTSLPLIVGSNTITVKVTAGNGTTKIYTVTVTRGALSNNTDLSGLVLSSGTLSPVFGAGTINYTASVGNGVSSITIKPTVADSRSTVSVNDVPVNSGEASASLPLIVGSNTITVKVTAEDGTFKTYTVTVTRAASSNADLSDLALSSGTLTPSFLPGTYKAGVGNNVSSVTIKPTAADPTYATVMISLYNGSGDLMSGPLPVASGTASPSLALGVGNNTISLLVTAEDGTTKTYTVTITRGASSDAELSNLTLSNGTLTPAFGGTYTASVGNSVNSITVTATFSDAVDAAAAASVYDSGGTLVSGPHLLISGEASPSLPLSVGSNEISIIVTAQDGTSRTYTVMVTRAV
ncbi:sugar lactone lactonase YvrE, partial [Paenibacillus cellulosilyticus]